jgi:hypothetical protein
MPTFTLLSVQPSYILLMLMPTSFLHILQIAKFEPCLTQKINIYGRVKHFVCHMLHTEGTNTYPPIFTNS